MPSGAAALALVDGGFSAKACSANSANWHSCFGMMACHNVMVSDMRGPRFRYWFLRSAAMAMVALYGCCGEASWFLVVTRTQRKSKLCLRCLVLTPRFGAFCLKVHFLSFPILAALSFHLHERIVPLWFMNSCAARAIRRRRPSNAHPAWRIGVANVTKLGTSSCFSPQQGLTEACSGLFRNGVCLGLLICLGLSRLS